MKKVNELLKHALLFDSLIVARIQFVIMLTELKKMLRQELQCLSSKTTTVLSQ
jgi:hypothetical protein